MVPVDVAILPWEIAKTVDLIRGGEIEHQRMGQGGRTLGHSVCQKGPGLPSIAICRAPFPTSSWLSQTSHGIAAADEDTWRCINRDRGAGGDGTTRTGARHGIGGRAGGFGRFWVPAVAVFAVQVAAAQASHWWRTR